MQHFCLQYFYSVVLLLLGQYLMWIVLPTLLAVIQSPSKSTRGQSFLSPVQSALCNYTPLDDAQHSVFSELIKLCSVVHRDAHEDNQNTIMNKALWRCSLSIGNVCFLVYSRTQWLRWHVLMQRYLTSFLLKIVWHHGVKDLFNILCDNLLHFVSGSKAINFINFFVRTIQSNNIHAVCC